MAPPSELDAALEMAQARFDERRAKEGVEAALADLDAFFETSPAVDRHERGDLGVSFWLATADPEAPLVVFVPDRRLLDWGSEIETSSTGLTRRSLRAGPAIDSTCAPVTVPPRQEPEQLETARRDETQAPLRTAAILDSLDNDYDRGNSATWYNNRPRFIEALQGLGYAVDLKISRQFTAADVVEGTKAGIFVFTYHGISKDGHVMAFPDIDWDPAALTRLGAKACKPNPGGRVGPILPPADDCDAIHGVAGGAHLTILRASFFEKVGGPMPNNLVVLMACHQLAPSSQIPDALISRGAHTVIGSTQRGVISLWGRLMPALAERMSAGAWDVEGALSRVPNGTRRGVSTTCDVNSCIGVVPLGDGACTDTRSRDGSSPWAALTDLEASFSGAYDSSEGIRLSARLAGAAGPEAQLGTWSAPAGATSHSLHIPSATASVSFCARAKDRATQATLTPSGPTAQLTFDFDAPPSPAPQVDLPPCERVGGLLPGACPEVSSEVGLIGPARIVPGTMTFRVDPQIPVCATYDGGTGEWSPSPCYSAVRHLKISDHCSYLDPSTGEFVTRACQEILYADPDEQQVPWRGRWSFEGERYDFVRMQTVSGATCSDFGDFARYAQGGPSADPMAPWSARAALTLPCNLTFAGPRPDGLYGPTWVRVEVGIQVGETGRGTQTRHAKTEVYIPIDGDLRNKCADEG